MEIDLLSNVISEKQRIWRLFPGESYKYLNDFINNSVVFLDIPEFPMPEGKLENCSDILLRLLASKKAVEDYKRDNKPIEKPFKFELFANAKETKNRNNSIRSIINFFDKAEKDDLVVVPSSLNEGKILIGKITSETSEWLNINHTRFPDLQFPAKSISWLVEFPESKISDELRSKLRVRVPFTLIEKSLYPEIFSIAYDNFCYQGRYSSVIYNDKEDFLDWDANFISLLTQLSTYAAYKISEGKDDLSFPTLLDFIQNDLPIEFSCSLTTDVHSPGFNRFDSGNIAPLIISALFTTLLHLPANATDLENAKENIKIINSKANGQEDCSPSVQASVSAIINSANLDTLKKMCLNAHNSKNRAGLRSKNKLTAN